VGSEGHSAPRDEEGSKALPCTPVTCCSPPPLISARGPTCADGPPAAHSYASDAWRGGGATRRSGGLEARVVEASAHASSQSVPLLHKNIQTFLELLRRRVASFLSSDTMRKGVGTKPSSQLE
jgi:hypothetical protein